MLDQDFCVDQDLGTRSKNCNFWLIFCRFASSEKADFDQHLECTASQAGQNIQQMIIKKINVTQNTDEELK